MDIYEAKQVLKLVDNGIISSPLMLMAVVHVILSGISFLCEMPLK